MNLIPAIVTICFISLSCLADCESAIKMIFSKNNWNADTGESRAFSSCKELPFQKDTLAIVIAFTQADSGTQNDVTEYDLAIAYANKVSNKILAFSIEKGALTSDAEALDGIGIDTGVYSLAPQKRAIGIVAHHSHSGGVNSTAKYLSLYMPQDAGFQKILSDLRTYSNSYDRSFSDEQRCTSSASEVTRTIAIAKTSSNGYFDLIVHTNSDEQEMVQKKGRCKIKKQNLSHSKSVKFNGKEYILPGDI